MVSVNYEGKGIYQHYKGGIYEVLGLGVREETVVKSGDDKLSDAFREGAGEPIPSPTIVVIYKPLSPGSLLGRGTFHGIDFWERTLEDFDAQVMPISPIADEQQFKVVPGEPPISSDAVAPVPRFKLLALKS